ncbi:MAG: pentapeptide repeat-containing protein [Planctomycetaceae bacterium]
MLRGGPKGIERWNATAGKWWFSSIIDLRDADFRRVDLTEANLLHAHLDGCDFREAVVSKVRMGAVADARFDGATGNDFHVRYDATRCSFRRVELRDSGIACIECNLDGARFEGGSLDETIDCTARNAELRSVRLGDCARTDFTDSELVRLDGGFGASGAKSRFDRANLSEAVLESADLTGASFHKAVVCRSQLAAADFTDADLSEADLDGVNAPQAKFRNADLTNATLRGACLRDADFRGATLDGADFAGAQVAGAMFDEEQVGRAAVLVLQPKPKAGAPGPNVARLEAIAAQCVSLQTEIRLDLENGERVELSAWAMSGGRFISSDSHIDARGNDHHDTHLAGKSMSDHMQGLANRWAHGNLRIETVNVKTMSGPVSAKDIRLLVAAAWCEVFGLHPPTQGELNEADEQQRTALVNKRNAALASLRSGSVGVAEWNERSFDERRLLAGFRGVELKGLDLNGVQFKSTDIQKADFTGSKLVKANLRRAVAKKAVFDRVLAKEAVFTAAALNDAAFQAADLKQSAFSNCNLLRVNFRGADLTGSNLQSANIRGADFTDATLDGVVFERTKFDETTIFPIGFELPEGLVWAGKGKDPRLVEKVREARESGPVDFEGFMRRLEEAFDASRFKKALAMLKAERFQLFAEVEDAAVTGVVKSQSDPDLVYACRLDAEGEFACCTQNLNPCGGLRGALCKHLLVLVVGLTKGEQLDPAKVHGWVAASALQKPQLDKDRMSEVFLKYKGAEAGEIDWRPTETVPEDFYAF